MYVFPAVFHSHHKAEGIGVSFPDLPGCISHGDSQEEAYAMATEALKGHLYTLIESGQKIPNPSPFETILYEDFAAEGEKTALVLISVSKKAVTELGKRSVKKTLTIPQWLNDLAEKQSVNYSQILQEALKERLDIDRHSGNVS